MAENTNDSSQQRVAPSTVYKVEGSPDDYDYVLRGADLVLVNKETNSEQVFMFVGNIMSLDGKVDMQFASGETLESPDLFNRSEMPEMEKEEETNSWEVQEKGAPVSSPDGNTTDGDGLNPDGTSLLSAQAAPVVDPTRSILSTQSSLLSSSSGSGSGEEDLSSEVEIEAKKKQDVKDNDNDGEGEKKDDLINELQDKLEAETTPDPEPEPEPEPEPDPTPDPGGDETTETLSVPTVMLSAGEDTGLAADDNVTKNQNLKIEGEADKNASEVKIFVDGEYKITATVTDGKYSTTINGLNDANYKIHAIAVKDDVESEKSTTLNVEVDATTPGLPSMELSADSDTSVGTTDIYTNDKTLTLKGSGGEDGSQVTISYSSDGTNYTTLDTATVGGDGSWSYTLTDAQGLDDGKYSFKLTTKDLAGNEASGARYLNDVNVKTTDPSSLGLDLSAASDSFDTDATGTDVDNTTNAGGTDSATQNTDPVTLNVLSASDDTAKVEIFIQEGGTYTSIGHATQDATTKIWSFDVPTDLIKDDGLYRFVAELTDQAGNIEGRNMRVPLGVTIDRTAPVNAATIDLLADSDSVDSHGDDDHTLIGSDEDDYTNKTTLNLKGIAAVGAPIDLYVIIDGVETLLSDDITAADGTWAYSYDASAYGKDAAQKITFKAVVKDAADNETVTEFDVTVDQHAPTKPSIDDIQDRAGDHDSDSSGTEVVVRNSTAVLTGTVDEKAEDIVLTVFIKNPDGSMTAIADSVSVADGGLGGVAINSDGTAWTYDYGAITNGETYTFYVQAEDKAGNESSMSKPFVITCDTDISTPTLDLADGYDFAGGPGGTTGDDYTRYPDSDPDNNIKFKVSGADKSEIKVYLVDASATDAAAIMSGEVNIGTGVLVGTVTQDSADNWPEVSFDASDYNGTTGELTFVAVSTDKAGNSKYFEYKFTLDTEAPDAGGITLDSGDDHGTDATDEITNAKEILLSGTLEEGSTAVKVTIFDNNVEIGTAEVKSDGAGGYKWEYVIGDETSANEADFITEGNHSYTAIIEDNAGNQTTLDALPVEIDRSIADPTFTLSTDDGTSDTGRLSNDGVTNATSLLFKGTSDKDDIVTVHKIAPDGTDTIIKTFVAGSASWDCTVESGEIGTEGDYKFYVTTSDVAGNSGSTAKVDVTIDRTTYKPGDLDLTDESDSSYTDGTFTGGTSNTDDTTFKESITLTGDVKAGEVEAGSTVYLYIEGVTGHVGSAVLGADATTWSISVDKTVVPNDQTYNFYVKYVDLAGNESVPSESLPVHIDRDDPDTPAIAINGDLDDDYFVDAGKTYIKELNPTFNFTNLEDGTVLNIKIDGQSVATPTVSGDSLTFVPDPFAGDHSDDGEHTVTVVAVDKAGNVSGEQTFTFTLDTKIDPVTAVQLVDASNTGATDDTITYEDHPQIQGKAEAGSTVSVILRHSDGTEITGLDVTADSHGNWVFNLPDGVDLSEGVYTVNVTSTDHVEHTASDSSYSFTVDTTIAEVGFSMVNTAENDTGFYADDEYTNVNNPKFSWTAKEDLTAEISIYKDGVLVKTYPDIDSPTGANIWPASGSYEGLLDGDYTAKLTLKDTAGNTVITDDSDNTVTEQVAFTVDTSAPSLTVNPLDGGADLGVANDWKTNDEVVDGTGLTLNGTAEGAVRLYVYVNDMVTTISNGETLVDAAGNNYITVGSGGAWNFDLAGLKMDSGLQEGDNTIKVVAEDKAGNKTTFTETLEIDLEVSPAGLIQLDSVSDSGHKGDNTTNLLTPTLTGTTEGKATVKLMVDVDGTVHDLGSVTAASDGTWSIPVSSGIITTDGTYTFTAYIIDEAGNTTNVTQDITVDRDPMIPTITDMALDSSGNFFGTDSDFITKDTEPEFTLKTEAHTQLDVYITGTGIDVDHPIHTVVSSIAANNGDGTLSYTPAELGEGTYTFKFVSTDSAGNESESTQQVVIDPQYNADDLSIAIHTDYDSGISSTDGLTYENRPILTGDAEAGSRIRVYISDRCDTLGAANAAARGDDYRTEMTLADDTSTWEYTPSALGDDGFYKVTIVSEDEAGNEQIKTTVIELDRTPPTGSTFALSDAGDDNTIITITETTDNTPLLTGVAEKNTTVNVTVNRHGSTDNELTFSVTTDANGKWEYQVAPGDSLADGSYDVKMTNVDNAGNEAQTSGGFMIRGETPVAPTINLDSADDSHINTDGITNHTTDLTLTGIAQSHCTVRIFKTSASDTDRNGGSFVASAEAGSNGIWSLDLDGTFTDGEYYYYAMSDYGSGTTYTSEELLKIEVDSTTISPTLELVEDTAVSDGWIADATDNTDSDWVTSKPTLTGVVDKGATVVIEATDKDGHVTKITIDPENLTKDGDTWSYTHTMSGLADGAYTVKVTTTDPAGNVAYSSEETLTIDTSFSKPTIDLPDTSDSSVNSSGDEILFPNGNDAGPALLSQLPDGYISNDTDGYTRFNNLPLTGTADKGSLVRIEIFKDGDAIDSPDVFTVTNDDGSWSYNTGVLEDGLYTFRVTSTDTAGNEKQAETLDINVDAVATRAAEVALNDSIPGDHTPNTDPTFTLYGDSDSTWLLYLDGGTEPVATGSFGSNSATTYQPGDLVANVDHTYKLVTVDRAGNVQVSEDFTFKIDTIDPEHIEGPDITDGAQGSDGVYYTGNNTADITITVEPGTAARILGIEGYNTAANAADINTGWVYDTDGDGKVTFSLDSGVVKTDGEYNNITVQYRDLAQNHDSDEDHTFDMVVDTVKPETEIKLDSASDHGFNNSDNITSGDQITLSGSIFELGAGQESGNFSTDINDYSITVTRAGSSDSYIIDSDHITLNADGSWSATFGTAGEELASGDYTAKLSATDLAGNTHNSTVDFEVDNDAAGVLENAPDLGWQEVGSFGVLISSDFLPDSANASDYRYELSYYKENADGSVTSLTESESNFKADGTLEEFINTDTVNKYDYVGIKVIDSAGNESDTSYVTLDTGKQFVGFTDTDDNADVATVNVTIAGDLDNDGTTDVTYQHTATVVDNSWAIDFTSDLGMPELADGEYTLLLEGHDSSDKVMTAASESTYDFTVRSGEIFAEGDGGGDPGAAPAPDPSAPSTDNVELEATVHTDHIDGIA